MTTQTHGTAGARTQNHNQTLVQAPEPTPSLTVKTRIKAAALNLNHNQTLVRARAR
jgi:hypothetical protein